MHIAILMTNTDDSAFSDGFPRDGEKFAALLAAIRPDWTFSVFSVKDGVFPQTLDGIDGFILTGSPASVHDADPWVARLLGLIRDIHADQTPMFGACFGHQAIALALGGSVERNPGGWVLGLVDTQMADLGTVRLYAAHLEQVTALPDGAQITGQTQGCAIAAFTMGSHIKTTQYHPEMTPSFMAALVEELAPDLPPTVITRARASLQRQADTDRMAAAMVDFFQSAAQDRAASKSIAVT